MPNPIQAARRTVILENAGIKVPVNAAKEESSVQSNAKTKSVLERITDCVRNIFKNIKNLFASIFYRVFYCKAPPTDVEKQYSVFTARKERVDSLSDELTAKEANEFPVVYTRLGKDIFKGSYNLPWKAWVCMPFLGRITYYEIGKKHALDNSKALIPHLKSYYESEITRIENQIKRG